ncbi:SWIM zinc finger family protein [Streptantibioticus ferralitis]|uniref:SWIM zinc finger family protein n=1 Tax=Streptantibioticus ferralitis TaxID=236510 RepID=A0ABT5YV68_9ACTN|nr:SWIM zinc finger family protein [Streptantibioticus ferralitis]MDF2255491.1 SWIM zinc finger family protein [Streptantibioticus ferralitis]
MSPSRRSPTRGKRAFAATWWGQAWVTALEDSSLDSGRLSRGRTYARQGMVGEVTISPGAVTAPVQGSRPRPYRTSVRVPTLTDRQWDTLLGAIVARAGHAAALLDGEMPQDLVDDARSAGVPLLPRPTELDPDCSCPDWGYPCKHAAALCYAIAASIDADPFVLFGLRGRTKEKVFEELRHRRGRTAGEPAPQTAPAGLPAASAYARWAADRPELPEPPALTPTRAPVLPPAPPPASGLTATGLQRLAADTAARAARLLAGDTASLELTQHQDALRLAASHNDPEWFHGIRTSTGVRPAELSRLTRAWRHGGAAGVTAAEEPFTPEPATMAAARTAVARALRDMDDDTAGQRLRAWRNRLTLEGAGLQLRLGPDARWTLSGGRAPPPTRTRPRPSLRLGKGSAPVDS